MQRIFRMEIITYILQGLEGNKMKHTGLQIGKILSKLVFLPFLIFAFYLGFFLNTGPSPHKAPAGQDPAFEHNHEEDIASGMEWTCSMHPQIRQPKPGKCPICAMDLIPVSNESDGESVGARELRLSEKARMLAGIRVAPVQRRPASAASEIRLPGKIEYNEKRISTITAWISGRIDGMYADFTGDEVKKGAPLVRIYSPELLATQEELFQSIQAVRDLQRSNLESIRSTAGKTVDAVREKLRLLGLSKSQIQQIETSGSPMEYVTINAPTGGVIIKKLAHEGEYVQTGTPLYSIADLSKVWVKLSAYESDLARLRKGQRVEFTTETYPGRKFVGRITFIDPFIDSVTRTAKVRLEVSNTSGWLKPEMLVQGVVRSGGSRRGKYAPLVIPASAPLITGERAVVYVAMPGEEGLYQGREVVLGQRMGDYYEVQTGMQEGEMVVVNGNFKIDSALQILAKPSMMNPESSGTSSGHNHAGHTAPATALTPGLAKDKKVEKTTLDFPNELNKIFHAYFAIHHGLSQDNLKEAQVGAAHFQKVLSNPPFTNLEGDVGKDWRTTSITLSKSAHAIQKTSDIAIARSAFSNLSGALITVADQIKGAGAGKVLQFNCPMAFNNQGADWLQDHEGVENPYFGAGMFRCGSQTAAYGVENKKNQ